MDYYKRYMGDYARDTSRLSMVEHGAYSLLMDDYYSSREPLPAEVDKLHRICRATTKEEQAAVATIANRFFPIGRDGLRHNKRADEEIAKWEELAAHNREVGKKGGNPLKKQKYNEPGSLYAARLPDGRVKVGITSDLSKRRYGLSRTHGAGVAMLHAVSVSDMGKAEAELLAEFDEFADGEILSLDEVQIDHLLEAMGRFGATVHQAGGLTNDANSTPVRQPSGVASGLTKEPVSPARLEPVHQPSPAPTPTPESRSLNQHQNTHDSRVNGDEANGWRGTEGNVPRGDDLDQLQRVKAAYPKGAYSESDWLEAQRYISQRIETGYTWDQVVAGCERFAAQCAVKLSSTAYVESPKNFFGPKSPLKFLEPFPLPEPSAAGSRASPPKRRWHPSDGDPTEPKVVTP
jgi:uncharacterized protein YdaU (DUF1376 family)